MTIVSRMVLASAAASLAANAAFAQAPITATITDWGRRVVEGTVDLPKALQGNGLAPAVGLRGARYVDHSDRVEARLCYRFGITVRLEPSGDASLPDYVQVRTRHPRFTRPDGATNVEDEFPAAVSNGESQVGFSFDHAWELQPGAWTMSILVDGRVLAEKTFTVVPPEGPPQPTDCQPGLSA